MTDARDDSTIIRNSFLAGLDYDVQAQILQELSSEMGGLTSEFGINLFEFEQIIVRVCKLESADE